VSKLKRNAIPKEGEVLNDRWYNVVQNDSYTWTKVSNIKATYALKASWQTNTRIFMGDVLWRGTSGKVYMSMDSKGRHFALKMLFYDPNVMESFDPERSVTTRQELMEELKVNLSTEAERWKKIYPEYELPIWEGILNEMPCLVMPYVASIPEKRRPSLKGKIENEMKRITELGFSFNSEVISWRRIGLRMDVEEKETIMFIDIEWLTEADKKRTSCENPLHFKKKKHKASNDEVESIMNRLYDTEYMS
jgi:hypothetical protein